ncbi:MAG: sigma factor [Armatimonadota bacterium]|nr:sigma factor [Armatimonadota bacterium]
MGIDNDFEDFDYAIYLISYKVGRIIGVLGFTFDDKEDLEQDLILHLLESWPQFDSQRGAVKTFINCVLDNRIRQIIESRKTQKSGFGKWTISLDERIEGEDGGAVTRIDAVDREEYMLRTGKLRRRAFDECDLRIAVEHVLSRLSPELRELCERLMMQNVTEISEETGIPRHRFYPSIRKLRCIFEEAGLKDCL